MFCFSSSAAWKHHWSTQPTHSPGRLGIIVFSHVVRPSPLFTNMAKQYKFQAKTMARLWVWPSGSLRTPVLYSFFHSFSSRAQGFVKYWPSNNVVRCYNCLLFASLLLPYQSFCWCWILTNFYDDTNERLKPDMPTKITWKWKVFSIFQNIFCNKNIM